MTQLQCVDCGSPLAPADIFCGVCGNVVRAASRGGPTGPEPVQVNTAAPGPSWAGTSAQASRAPAAPRGREGDSGWWRSGREPVEVVPPDQFFGHAVAQPGGPMSNSTRYLCAAAYLNPKYANTVIGELVASHRGVAPSLGIDCIPIIRHCLDARKAQVLRDVLLTVLLIAGLYLATAQMIAILAVAWGLSLLPGVKWESRSLGGAALVGLGIAVVLAAVVIFYLINSYFNASNGRAAPHFGPLASGLAITVAVLACLALICLVLVGYSYSMYRTFSDRLRPGESAGGFDRASAEAEARIAEIAAAQRGNLTIYGGDNPFIGTGPRLKDEDWSIAIELDRAPGPGMDSSRSVSRSGSYVPVDPVELLHVIRTRLEKVKDDRLPEHERISALSLHDHVVGDGHCPWDSPAIDQARTMPYSQASPEAIDALIRHPAAGLRYYLRVCVSDEHAARTSFRDIVRAPFRLIGTIVRMVAEQQSYRSEIRSASDYLFADMGARISVREFGGSAAARTYIQVLDTARYTRIVQRLVLDTVLDFLREKGVDTSTYQESASAVITNSVTIHGNVGAMATGSHGRAEGHVHGPSTSSAGSTGSKS